MHSYSRLRIVSLLFCAAAISPGAAIAGPALGFRENWSTSVGTWTPDGAVGMMLENPGLGGADGEGFLRLRLLGTGDFGARSMGPEYAGDWISAGIQIVRFSINNLGSPDGHEIHFAIGNATNLWQYDLGCIPSNQWTACSIDMTSQQGFTRVIGTGTFDSALRNVDRIVIRHDHAPYAQDPDDSSGDIGIDRLILLDATTRSKPGTWGLIKTLYR